MHPLKRQQLHQLPKEHHQLDEGAHQRQEVGRHPLVYLKYNDVNVASVIGKGQCLSGRALQIHRIKDVIRLQMYVEWQIACIYLRNALLLKLCRLHRRFLNPPYPIFQVVAQQ